MAEDYMRKIIIESFIAVVISLLKGLAKTLPAALIAGILAYVIIRSYERAKSAKIKKKVPIVLLVAYGVMVVQMSITARSFGSTRSIDLIPFNTQGGFRYIVLYASANLLMFIPLGILMPTIWESMRKRSRVLLAGFLASLFIESCQLILQCGVFQTEDMIMNTLGALVGYGIFLLYRKVRRKKERRGDDVYENSSL